MQEDHGNVDLYDDYLSGSEYLDAFLQGNIDDHDTVLLLSIDGAQLYEKKTSDCWIRIWVIMDFHPELRYKKKLILFGGIFPGPHKPKHFDSLTFPGIHHLSALQREGFLVWDASDDAVYTSHPFFIFGTADGPGVTHLNGLTGHVGYYSYRHYCPIKGRRAPGERKYYPAHLKPYGDLPQGSDHDDCNFARLPVHPADEYKQNLAYLIASRNANQYTDRRRLTGIVKPSLFSGLVPYRMLSIPGCFPGDLMHLIALNITDLLLSLWHGTIACKAPDHRSTWRWMVLIDEVWKDHSKHVANMTPHLPGSFDVPPRNPAERISSGYKAKEFLTYIFVLGPALLVDLLPNPYFQNFCKLVSAVRSIHQRRITPQDVVDSHNLLVEFVQEFETIYYQRKPERLHFCRPSIHSLLHLAREVIRLGPPCYYTQWTMERTIGNITEEMKQPSRSYQNLSQRGLRRTQVNALKAMAPELDKPVKDPRGSEAVGNGYLLLRAKDKSMNKIVGPASEVIRQYMQQETAMVDNNWTPHVHRWA